MQRREFMQVTGGAIASLTAGGCASAGWGGAASKPNLLFVFTDQQAWDMVGCYGNEQIKTPNVDEMAAEGIRFEHCVSSCPVCTPYRGMLLSGQHPLYNGCMVNDIQMLPGGGHSFGEVLRDAGYHTGYIGKWHLYGGNRERGIPAGPMRYGFDNEFFSNNCDLNYGADQAFYWDDRGDKVKLGKFESDGQTDQALSFLDKYAGREPFALFVSWHPPHNWGRGYAAPPEYEKLYDPMTLKLRPGCPDSRNIRNDYRGYMALCSNVDDNFGRLLKKLDELHVSDNTLVVYTSDHGDILKSHGLGWHKSRPRQISSRVPLVMRMRGKFAPRVSNMLVGTLDLMPTTLGLMHIKAPASCQGSDYSTAMKAGKDEVTESIPMFFWGCDSDWRGLYTHRYTYAFEPKGARKGINVLFDRQEDPYELKNLFNSPVHREIKQALHSRTLAWMQRFGDDHVPWNTVKHKIYVEPDAAQASWEPMWVGSAALKGRPVDLL